MPLAWTRGIFGVGDVWTPSDPTQLVSFFVLDICKTINKIKQIQILSHSNSNSNSKQAMLQSRSYLSALRLILFFQSFIWVFEDNNREHFYIFF